MFKPPVVYNRPSVALFVACFDVNFRAVFNLCMYRLFEPRCEKNRSSGFPTRSDTNQAVQ